MNLISKRTPSSQDPLDKRESQKQWDTDPCGAVTAADQEPGTLSFYRSVRQYRYTVYGPWFNSQIGFDQIRNVDVLEVGAGLGSDHYRFAVNGNRLTALDLSIEHLRHTTRHLALEGLATRPVLGDAESLPFDDATFDVVYSFGVLHHTPGTQQAIDEIYRVLRPGGIAVVGLYHRDSFFFWAHTILSRGIVLGLLWKKGHRRLMADIEYRSDPNSALPLVKVYSRNAVRRLFRRFPTAQVSTCHVELSHTGLLYALISRTVPGSWLGRIGRSHVERLFSWGGWYVIARARKQ